MADAQLADIGGQDAARHRLLTSVAELRHGIESLPEPEDPAFYPGLAAVVTERLPALHAACDAWIASVLITDQRRITCSRTCSACCRHYVSSVEPFELIALDLRIKNRPDYADAIIASHARTVAYEAIVQEENLRALESSGTSESNPGTNPDTSDVDPLELAEDKALYRYFVRGHACPFLQRDGACGVYEHRPMACRTFFAESSPRFCEGKALASPWNRNFQVELPQEVEEALARCSRLLEHLELPEGLFPGLVAVNALFGRHEVPAMPPSPSPSGPETTPP